MEPHLVAILTPDVIVSRKPVNSFLFEWMAIGSSFHLRAYRLNWGSNPLRKLRCGHYAPGTGVEISALSV